MMKHFYLSVATFARLILPSFGHANVPQTLPPSCNTPENRQCWGEYDINTDYSVVFPNTGVIREYELVASNMVVAPDGVEVLAMVFNEQLPGPIIEADWGDTLRITVYNNLTNLNGTSVHYHGIRQLNSNWDDGVPGVTQCPITPGSSYTYEISLTQYGTSFYHSHFDLQYSAGLGGLLKINGPTSMNYDVDLGPVMLSDWYHENPFVLFDQVTLLGADPNTDSTLLQGQGVYCDDTECTGSYYEIIFEQGTTYKLSVVNGGSSSQFTVWLDGHDFTVVGTDFVPIQPYVTDFLTINIGQRYDLIITANASLAAGTDFWFHAEVCGGEQLGAPAPNSTVGIIRYNSSSTDLPSAQPAPTGAGLTCLDPEASNLVPVVAVNVGQDVNGLSPSEYLNVSFSYYPNISETSATKKLMLQNQPFVVNWSEPTLSLLIANNDTDGSSFPPALNPIFLDYPDTDWVYWLIETNYTSSNPIQNTIPFLSHPIHLHGHDFYVLTQSSTPFNASNFALNLSNPPRRDVATVPAGGYMVIAFKMDNPGAWLMHCHIAWHSSSGMAVQFVESAAAFEQLAQNAGVLPQLQNQCAEWTDFYNTYNVVENAAQGASSGI